MGKSSLLNALLDEDSVLPTSGSQGCTVELSFNFALVDPELAAKDPDIINANVGCSTNKEVPVYQADVEFMKKEDWEDELRHLVRECTTEKGVLNSAKPSVKQCLQRPQHGARSTKVRSEQHQGKT